MASPRPIDFLAGAVNVPQGLIAYVAEAAELWSCMHCCMPNQTHIGSWDRVECFQCYSSKSE